MTNHTNNRLIGKAPATGKDQRQKEKRVAECEMVRWHHYLKGQESEQTSGDSEGQGSLACRSSQGGKDLAMT